MKIFKALLIGFLVTLFAAGCSLIQEGKTKPIEHGQSPDPMLEPQKGSDSVQSPKPEEPIPAPTTPVIVVENEAFRIFEPEPSTVVGNTVLVKGEARVFEGVLNYFLEDGHNVLVEGHVKASKGAPEWGSFEIQITIDQPPTSPSGVLVIFEESAKDGSPTHELHIPVTFKQS